MEDEETEEQDEQQAGGLGAILARLLKNINIGDVLKALLGLLATGKKRSKGA